MQTAVKKTNPAFAFVRKHFSIIILALLIAYNCIATNNFVSWITFSNLFIQTSKIGLVALGMTFVIATGGIDISVGSTMSLGALISALFLLNNQPWGILVSLIVCIVMGLLSGTLVSKFGILPMVATLSMRYIMRGLAKGISGKGTITYNKPALTQFFIKKVFGKIPIHFFILLLVAVFMYILVNRMRFGSRVEAYGNNPQAARICGINTTAVIIMCYVICAICAWGSGMLEMISVSSANPSKIGLDMENDAIAAVLIGGTSINGGYPNALGSICGAFVLQLVQMMCNMQNIPYALSLMIKGGIILFALIFHGLGQRKK